MYATAAPSLIQLTASAFIKLRSLYPPDHSTCPHSHSSLAGWDLQENMHGTAWHSVHHIRNVVIPELSSKVGADVCVFVVMRGM